MTGVVRDKAGNKLNSPTRTFDQRLSSKLSEHQLSPSKSLNHSSIKSLQFSETDSIDSIDSSNNKVYTLANLKWMKMAKISDQIFSSSSKSEYGEPTLLTISDEYIAIATSKNYILLFNFKQILLMTVKTDNVLPMTTITALSLSIDSTYVVAGYSNGFINLWDLKKIDPIISIQPTTFHELQYNGTHYHIAHMEGFAIRQISFVGSRHTGFVSSDESGMLIYHNGGRSLIGYSCRSKIIYGKYDLNNIVSKSIDYSNTILDYHLLPVGSKLSCSDTMNLLSVITPHSMNIISLHPTVITYFTLVKPKISNQNIGMSGSVSWYPSTIDETGKTENLPMLAYAWSNILSVLEIHAEYIINDLAEEVPTLSICNKRFVECSESILTLCWLNSRVLVALTRSQKLIFYDAKTLVCLKEEDIMFKQLKSVLFFPNNKIGLIGKAYSGSIAILKSNIFILQKNEIAVGNLANWADVLLDLLNEGKYFETLEESKRQYIGGDDLALIKLPEDDNVRHTLMEDYLFKIFKSSLKYVFVQNSENIPHDFKKTTTLLIQTCLTIHAPVEMYDLIYEKLLEFDSENIFFEVLENFIFSSEIVTFSPTILKAMVNYYTNENDITTLERLICLLDIEQLDIDLTVTLCKKYHLNETLTYIWTNLLHDYLTPLIEAVLRIKRYNEERDNLTKQQRLELANDINYVYPYISYTLTGRQYPTDKLFPYEYCLSAKLNIYYFLFNGSSISWPVGSPKIHTVNDYKVEPAFPYLYALLKYDSESMFTSLNEAFEDDLLNENEMAPLGSAIDNKYQLRVNRQYIMDVLLGLLHDADSEFSTLDRIRLAIFITRNYPKYLQFIRLADSMSDEMITLLCKAGSLSKEDTSVTSELIQDCELGLQCLLSVYKPLNINMVIAQVDKAGYYHVLLYIYQVEEMYVDVLKLWVRLQVSKVKNKGSMKDIDLFKPISEIIRDAFMRLSPSETDEIIKLIQANFELIVKADPKGIAQVFCKECPELHSNIIYIDDQRIKFEFLKEIFNFQNLGKPQSDKMVGPNLKVEYLKSLIKQKHILENEKGNDATVLEGKGENINAKIENFVLGLETLTDDLFNILKSEETDGFNILIKWYIVKFQYQKAIDIICDTMATTAHGMCKNGYNDVSETKVWLCLNKAFSLLSTNDKRLYEKQNNGLQLKEMLLLQLVESSVSILTSLTKEPNVVADAKIIDIYKKVVQSVFTFVINASHEDSSSFNDIFKRFLDGSSVHLTTLGDVQLVLKEIFLSYHNDKEILTYIQTLVDEDIFQNLMVLESLKVKGWSPMHIECETCGKRIWGSKIGGRVYESYRNHKLKELEKEQVNNEVYAIDPLDKANELYVFQCRHTYHRKCLDSMGMVDDTDKKCILCNSN